MCIAIYKPAGKRLVKKVAKTCFDNNDDGAGFAFAVDGRLLMHKGYMRFKPFWKMLNSYQESYPDSPAIIHFRIATHGKIDKVNCHPHMIREDLCFIHNGIFSNVVDDKKRSDTMVFNEEVLSKLPKNFEDDQTLMEMLKQNIGSSKIIMLRADGSVYIVDQYNSGVWSGGLWYSNTTYKYHWYYKYTKDYDWDREYLNWRKASFPAPKHSKYYGSKAEEKLEKIPPEADAYGYICSYCGLHYNEEDLQYYGRNPVCPDCLEDLMDYDYEQDREIRSLVDCDDEVEDEENQPLLIPNQIKSEF